MYRQLPEDVEELNDKLHYVIIVLPVDKGNTTVVMNTVVMNTSDYREKMKTFLLDKTYTRFDKDKHNRAKNKDSNRKNKLSQLN